MCVCGASWKKNMEGYCLDLLLPWMRKNVFEGENFHAQKVDEI